MGIDATQSPAKAMHARMMAGLRRPATAQSPATSHKPMATVRGEAR